MSDYVQRLKQRTLATFHAANPSKPEEANKGLSQSTLLARREGSAVKSFKADSGAKVNYVPCECRDD
jgi:hypothetical protein